MDLTMSKEKEITILMPAYNESEGIVHSISVIDQILSKTKLRYEFLVIDDGSSDDTWGQLRICSGRFPLKALRLSRNFGKEAALRAGLENAAGEMVVILDSDLQHPPAIIPDMIKLMKETGADVVEGIRDDRGSESLINRIFAYWFYKAFSALTRIDLEKASDFKLMNRKAVNAYLKMEEKTLFFRGMSAWIGFKREQIIFKTDDRIAGSSKWSKIALFKLAKNAILSFSSSPLHIPTYCGIFFCLFALGVIVESLYRKIIHQSSAGFPTVIIMLGLVGGLILFSLGIIGEYLAKIYQEVKSRPAYLIGDETSYEKKKNNRNRG